MAGTITRHFATVGRRQIHYRRAGIGPPIILLHPSPESSVAFVPLIDRLSDRYTVLAPDTPGNGLSDPLEAEWPEMAAFAGNIVALLDVLEVPKAAIYGYHTGALCALELARRYPNRVALCVANGYLQMDETLRRDIVDNYFVRLAPIDWSGSHLTWIWSRMREQWNFFPWYKKTLPYRGSSDPPDAEDLHRAAMDMLTAGDGYRGAYRAAFTFDAAEAVQQLRAATLITCPRDDILFPCLAAMPKPADCVRVEAADDLGACEALLERTLDTSLPSLPPPKIAATKPIEKHIWSDTIQLGDKTLHMRRSTMGAGRPLVFIHDTAGSSKGWQPLMEALIGRRPLIGIDLPGRGQSDPWPKALEVTVDGQAEILSAALSTIGYSEADLVADRGGAAIAVALAEQGSLARHLFIVEMPHGAEGSDIGRLAPILDPDPYGGHLLRAWHCVRDWQLFAPWYDRRTEHSITWREPDLDPAHTHQDVLDLIASAPLLPELLAAERAYPLIPKLLALKLPTLIGFPNTPLARRIAVLCPANIVLTDLNPLDPPQLAAAVLAFAGDAATPKPH